MKKLLSQQKKKSNLFVLYILGLILAFSTALPTYIQSNFLGQFVSLSTVSLFFVSANIISVASIIFFPETIKALGNCFVTKIVLVVHGVSLLALSLASSPGEAFFFFIIFSLSTNLLWINMDIFVENFSDNASTGKTRGIYFTFMNLGWISAPLVAGYLIKHGEYSWPFMAAALALIPFFLIFLRHSKNLQDQTKYNKIDIRRTIKAIWQKRNFRGVFGLSLLLNLFFSGAVVYIPLYLHQSLGMDWGKLGLVFAFMLLPFIIFEIPAGIIADRKLGEKEIFHLGFSILIISLLAFFWIKSDSLVIWAIVLFFSRIGASLVEAMREAYFFKKIDVKEVGLINFFRTTTPLGYLLGTGLGAIIFRFYALENLFLIMAILMLSSFYFLHIMKDTK